MSQNSRPALSPVTNWAIYLRQCAHGGWETGYGRILEYTRSYEIRGIPCQRLLRQNKVSSRAISLTESSGSRSPSSPGLPSKIRLDDGSPYRFLRRATPREAWFRTSSASAASRPVPLTGLCTAVDRLRNRGPSGGRPDRQRAVPRRVLESNWPRSVCCNARPSGVLAWDPTESPYVGPCETGSLTQSPQDQREISRCLLGQR